MRMTRQAARLVANLGSLVATAVCVGGAAWTSTGVAARVPASFDVTRYPLVAVVVVDGAVALLGITLRRIGSSSARRTALVTAISLWSCCTLVFGLVTMIAAGFAQRHELAEVVLTRFSGGFAATACVGVLALAAIRTGRRWIVDCAIVAAAFIPLGLSAVQIAVGH